jgi:hypothetical protein
MDDMKMEVDIEMQVAIFDTIQQTFRQFIMKFRVEQMEEDEPTFMAEDEQFECIGLVGAYYLQLLAKIDSSEVPVLNVNLQHVRTFEDSLYKIIVAYPAVSSKILN